MHLPLVYSYPQLLASRVTHRTTLRACQMRWYEAPLRSPRSTATRRLPWQQSPRGGWPCHPGHRLVPTPPARARCTYADRPSGGCAGGGDERQESEGRDPEHLHARPLHPINPEDRLAEQRQDFFPRTRRRREGERSPQLPLSRCTLYAARAFCVSHVALCGVQGPGQKHELMGLLGTSWPGGRRPLRSLTRRPLGGGEDLADYKELQEDTAERQL